VGQVGVDESSSHSVEMSSRSVRSVDSPLPFESDPEVPSFTSEPTARIRRCSRVRSAGRIRSINAVLPRSAPVAVLGVVLEQDGAAVRVVVVLDADRTLEALLASDRAVVTNGLKLAVGLALHAVPTEVVPLNLPLLENVSEREAGTERTQIPAVRSEDDGTGNDQQ
jgi:hypothetical protein